MDIGVKLYIYYFFYKNLTSYNFVSFVIFSLNLSLTFIFFKTEQTDFLKLFLH